MSIDASMQDTPPMMDFIDSPYAGLFGNTVIAKVVEEIIADPHSVYRPKDLEDLTEASSPSIRDALMTLAKFGLLNSSGGKHPAYTVNKSMKTFVALTFLAYGVLDDRKKSDCMNTAIHHYCETSLKPLYEPYAIASTMKLMIRGTGYQPDVSTNVSNRPGVTEKICIGGAAAW